MQEEVVPVPIGPKYERAAERAGEEDAAPDGGGDARRRAGVDGPPVGQEAGGRAAFDALVAEDPTWLADISLDFLSRYSKAL